MIRKPMDCQFWTERAAVPAAILYLKMGGDAFTIIAPHRLLTAGEQDAALGGFRKFCNLIAEKI